MESCTLAGPAYQGPGPTGSVAVIADCDHERWLFQAFLYQQPVRLWIMQLGFEDTVRLTGREQIRPGIIAYDFERRVA